MKTAMVALCVLALAACSPQPAPPVASSAPSASGGAAAAVDIPPASAANRPATRGHALATLTQYHWQLATASDPSGRKIDALFARADKPLQLDFTTHGIAISNTCNRMRASYSTAGNRIRIGALAATLMACPDAKLMALDKAVAQHLSGTLTFGIDSSAAAPVLTLTTAQGDRLVFAGAATAATRFGSDGQTVFLEVAPDTRPCNHPLQPAAQCLYVRELHYAANGVREGNPGAWHILAQTIEGYQHKTGVRNVLRVKRYKVANPPADASSTAYVLDMVVESHAPAH